MQLQLSAALTALLSLASASLISDVSKDTFQKLRKDHEAVLAAFTSKSLESLQPFNENFESAAQDVKTPLITIDCAKDADLCQEHDVKAYPAIRLFKRNETKRYRGRRTSSANHSIKSYVARQELPLATHVQPTGLAEFRKIDSINF
ncbi:hypothetical protein K469DRAFT_688791 [Zopfia rhizophila CBS 207.26]|uniref:Thioredoxin domain-containing protein n=1 Tax=Zopfia rhizophila CBS 207.26 TaxID=1314779 RepID=A0A6A6DX90_9PEZI|nr:hypothetical protein K469DRAFT_688791 [Zopfia rhizophila CBS 207.26]